MISEGQPKYIQQEFVANLEAVVRQRVLQAPSISLLSDRNNKRVEAVRDVNDARFIRRSYEGVEVARIEQVGLTYAEAWDEMHGIFGDAGIALVPSTVFYPSATESRFPVVIASEYVEGEGMKSADVDTKTKLATSLGNVLLRTSRYRPSLESFTTDMFRVRKDATGAEMPVLIDVDPYLVDQEDRFRRNESAKDTWYAAYIGKVSSLLWDTWCRPGEGKVVIGAFLRSLSPLARELDSSDRSRTFHAMMEAHSMTQGLDLRNFQL